ncbi:MAG: acyl-CoA dehydrogenase family protein [Actinobacteria bacterium]|nr:acyl-CoA dehydrogenase family protein [Actinomycetota bacterium]
MSHLEQARTIVEALRAAIDGAVAHLAPEVEAEGRVSTDLVDDRQTVVYDLASLASSVAAAEELLPYGEEGELEAKLAHAFAADVYADLRGRLAGRWTQAGVDPEGELSAPDVGDAVQAGRDPAFLSEIADAILDTGAPPRHLSEEWEMVRDTFRRFADDQVKPVAEEIHREDRDIPDRIIQGLAELGTFGLSVPTEYGGMAEGGEDELINMVLVTEELSRGSLGVAGSLITRPEIITAAILNGGTEEQKQRWLPEIASGEKMCAVAVTEPDYGSDVAMLKTTATRDGDQWVINGVKTWCTFAGKAEYLLLLARTDPDRSEAHRGLSLFVVDKPSHDGHAFRVEQQADGGEDGRGSGGVMDARAISTIGYRGMHSFEISFDGWRVPHENLIGMEDGLGQGFYYQMQAFASGRLQTAARANGVMHAALEDAVAYSQQRKVFATPLAEYELSRTKIARMAFLLAACRQLTLRSARLLAQGEGQLEASMVKQLACRVAEWVTREAQQLHGGYGYAEEYAVSRYFVDARVLSIFEGADEVLALRVIARTLLGEALGD